ncbi:MAG: hypothetical protein WEC75_04740 [Dehalococcoidia bacterium]
MKRFLVVASIALALGWLPAIVRAQEPFSAPDVRVVITDTSAGAHPDQQTIIDAPTGPGFDQISVTAPLGSTIAADKDIPDGTVVGRLDAVATTNAITLPECTLRVEFTVPIREATADIASPGYPDYLRRLAPGEHRLRLVADVSPSPEIPVLINYLFDVHPISGAVVTQVLVGDPDNPPAQFEACTPQWSRSTLFGVMPGGAPLITVLAPPAGEPQPFRFEFTSRPDEDGGRHVQAVEVIAEIAPIETEPVGVPRVATLLPVPANLQLTAATDGGPVILIWDYDLAVASSFFVQVEMPSDAGILTEIYTVEDATSVELAARHIAYCDAAGPPITYRVAALIDSRVASPFAELPPGDAFPACVQPPVPGTGVIGVPDTGSGPAASGNWYVWLALAGLACGVAAIAAGRRASGS